jgi:hypothetical protein
MQNIAICPRLNLNAVYRPQYQNQRSLNVELNAMHYRQLLGTKLVSQVPTKRLSDLPRIKIYQSSAI